jgi:hypothetical protein
MAENKFHYNNYSIPIAGSYEEQEVGEWGRGRMVLIDPSI